MAYIYLASPYSDPSELVQHSRYIQVSEVTVAYLKKGIPVYSPIVHCHEIARRHSLPKDFNFWCNYNYAMLDRASHLHVLELDGWEKSKGLQAEIRYAVAHNIPLIRIPYPLEQK